VGIVSNLLHAQRRSSSQSRRLTEAVDEALDAPIQNPDISAAEAVDAAAAAFQRTAREINAEKSAKRQVSEEQVKQFVEAEEDSGFEDEKLPTEPDPRNDEHFAPGMSTESEVGVEAISGAYPSAVEGDAEVSTGHPAASGDARYESPKQEADEDQLHPQRGDGADDNEEERSDREDGGHENDKEAVDEDAQDASSEDATNPNIPITQNPFDDAKELPPRFGAPVNKPAPTPSSQATAPADTPFDDLEPDEEPSFAERMRESLSAAFRRGGEEGRRGVWLAGAAGAVAVAIAGIFSLSGHRGEAPEPAGTVAAPPAQTENPSVAPSAAPLVPATVSASCVGDSDAVAPFAGEKSRAWVCGRAYGLDGSVLNITFNKPVVVTEITVVPGFNYVAPDGRDEWDRHRQVTGVTWRMGAKAFPQTINPTRTGSTMKFPSVITQEMSMTITASTRPPKSPGADGIGKPSSDNSADVDGTTAISSVVITGYPVDPGS